VERVVAGEIGLILFGVQSTLAFLFCVMVIAADFVVVSSPQAETHDN